MVRLPVKVIFLLIIILRIGQGDYFFRPNNTFKIDITKVISDIISIEDIIINDIASYVLIPHRLPSWGSGNHTCFSRLPQYNNNTKLIIVI